MLSLLFCLVSCATRPELPAPAPDKPNIVLIVADDLGWMDPGFMGSTLYHTPNLDRLSEQSVRFTNGYAGAANCAPSRAAMMTGRYAPYNGVYTVSPSDRGDERTRRLVPTENNDVPADSLELLSTYLQRNGYRTGHFGKWHLGEDPTTQGFDINVGGSINGAPRGTYFSPYRISYIENGPEGEYLTDRLGTEAIDFLREAGSEPFFLYLPFYSVHTPIQAPDTTVARYLQHDNISDKQQATYAAMVEILDRNVGRLLDELDRQQLSENTIVIFTSDNGGIDKISDQAPLRAGKGAYYEGGTRVPLLIRWPGKIAPRRDSTPVINLDFYPTLATLAGLPAPRSELDGSDLSDLLLHQQPLAERTLYWHFPIYLQRYRKTGAESRDPLFRTRPGTTLRQGKWKLHEYFEDGGVELYDLTSDLGESRNLAEEEPEITDRLLTQMREWRRRTAAPVPDVPNPTFDADFEREAMRKLEEVTVDIDTNNGHELERGSSGFNVRIADKVWSYTHPDFREAVRLTQPGWLRFFSGTMGDAFNSATGLYDKDYALMMDHQKQYFTGYAFTAMKGPHHISDLNDLLGENGAKLVVTINGFTESPEVTRELARFCKNHHIEVVAWQFCNEPYFYVPARDRYWWNDGYDYARKMKPHADAIRDVFPEAKLALNFTWDGIWDFAKEINRYQREEGAYWNVFSKHSYAPHVGKTEDYEAAYHRANTVLPKVTSPDAMKEIEEYTEKDIPLLITEFGVWNRGLGEIQSSIYVAEYTLRQLAHSNAWYIGSHEISSRAQPINNRKQELLAAWEAGTPLETDSLRTGVRLHPRGKALRLVHEATNRTDFTWDTELDNGPTVSGMKGITVPGTYARAFRGTGENDYLLLTNRSAERRPLRLLLDGKQLSGKVRRQYFSSPDAAAEDFPILEDEIPADELELLPNSVMLVSWKNERASLPTPTRIYRVENGRKSVLLTWAPVEEATGYRISYRAEEGAERTIEVAAPQTTHTVNDLVAGERYRFTVASLNGNGTAPASPPVILRQQRPERPAFFQTATRDTTITVQWKSVADADGYRVYATDETTGKTETFDAGRAFGYRIEDREYDRPYRITVAAYNGWGEGAASEPVTLTPREDLPLPARNISATEREDGTVLLRWISQDEDVRFRVYRGDAPYEYRPLAEGIADTFYVDNSRAAGREYYYTVRAYNDAGESNRFPNVATVIERDAAVNVTIADVQEMEDGTTTVRVAVEGIVIGGKSAAGVALSDVTYLNVEERILAATTRQPERGQFTVRVPADRLEAGKTYAVRAFIDGPDGRVFSDPPYRITVSKR
ncbi:arylsulfatase A-like enzyme/fibronectin type 3 domain-containing protein [Lewinella aquimaris]|uniref:Arylsulfatase A-like enzyme/fibronectin type 3 domain-containing protein n=1 Tax=Neolewinella aquimaris TaxID=1835722 RepID=A0A840E3I3_9BACT|nr:sulfatase-like hydrolase/transferase [Neolewinella aquimaris]MBB4080134.1 arylsulfatase A-like enzyme/fibronectin type 3 domain-containing protein [Neolewinella aquimaris]